MTTTTTSTDTNNGVNVEALIGAKAALTDAPEAAQFTWKTESTWMNGTHTRSTIEKFSGLGDTQSHKQKFSYDTDHPEIFAAQDNGATPVEMMLVGLAGCLTGGIASIAQYRGIQLTSVVATIEGDMDIQGILGIDSDVRNGFQNIRVHYTIDADATDEEIRALVAQSQKRSAVFDIITNPTNVHVDVN